MTSDKSVYLLTVLQVEQGLVRIAHFHSSGQEQELLKQAESCKKEKRLHLVQMPGAQLLDFPTLGVLMRLARACPWRAGLWGCWVSSMAADLPRARKSKPLGFLPGSGYLLLLILPSESPVLVHPKYLCFHPKRNFSLLLPLRRPKAQRSLFIYNHLCPCRASQCNSIHNLADFLCIKFNDVVHQTKATSANSSETGLSLF